MIAPRKSAKEIERLAALHALNILDTPAEERFDRIVRIAKEIFDVPIVAFSLVDDEREWFKSSVGIDVPEAPRDTSFCGHAVLASEIFLIPDASKDERFHDNPQVTGPSHIRFYAGQQIKSVDGHNIGSFCVKDQVPRDFNEQEKAMLRDLADIVENELNMIQISNLQQEIIEEKRHVELIKTKLIKINHELANLLSAISAILIGVNHQGQVYEWNSTAEEILKIKKDDAIGKQYSDLDIIWNSESVGDGIMQCIQKQEVVHLPDMSYKNNGGPQSFLSLTISPSNNQDIYDGGYIIMGTDITRRKNLETKLSQSQKLESIGQLAAGVAHEINTPIQFIGDNIGFMKESFTDLIDILQSHQDFISTLPDVEQNPQLKEICDQAEKIDLDFLKDEIPQALEQSQNGVNRVAHIVKSMKKFSHPGSDKAVELDINEAIESTITVSENTWKYHAELLFVPDPDIPEISCFPDELNQVILNIIVNATHAIEDENKRLERSKGTITIKSNYQNNGAFIELSDNGSGIPDDIKTKIFDPFFTTKDVGRGTGQGLSIAYSAIVDKHHGKISYDSKVGEGTTFKIWIPEKV